MVGEGINCVVLSKGRCTNVKTKFVIPDIKVVCPYDEYEQYVEYNPDLEIIPQPKGMKGITKARQFVLDTFDEVFMVDDDIEFMRRYYTDENEEYKILSTDHVKEVINQTCHIARQLGAKMFGYTHSRRPVTFKPQKPFRMTGFLNGSHTGFLKGHNLKYDLRLIEGEDHYMSALNVYQNRYMLIDDRFGFITTDNFNNDGGCSGDRNTEIMQRDTLMLREMFGDVIQLKQGSAMKKNIRLGERSVKFPF